MYRPAPPQKKTVDGPTSQARCEVDLAALRLHSLDESKDGGEIMVKGKGAWVEARDINELIETAEELYDLLCVYGQALDAHIESYIKAVRTGRVEKTENPIHRIRYSEKDLLEIKEIGEGLVNFASQRALEEGV